MKISPSVLAGDLADLRSVIATAEHAGVDYLHFDVMDGHFVPNLTFGPPLIRAARQHTSLPFDVHLMVTDPADYVEQLAGLEIPILSCQIETTHFAPRLIQRIRELGMGPAIALNPQTPLAQVEEVLPLVDAVLVMSVDPGFAGQSFIAGVMAKIARLAEIRRARHLDFWIEVDGGVGAHNLSELASCGVDIVVAGKAFFTAADCREFTALVQRAKG